LTTSGANSTPNLWTWLAVNRTSNVTRKGGNLHLVDGENNSLGKLAIPLD
jgi:hypothetical protein